jgi:hypothetical protein
MLHSFIKHYFLPKTTTLWKLNNKTLHYSFILSIHHYFKSTGPQPYNYSRCEIGTIIKWKKKTNASISVSERYKIQVLAVTV